MLATLRQRNFALLWFGGFISLTGDRVLDVALPFYVYQTTHSTLITATMVAAELLPHLLFGSLAGVLVDRWDRRRVMITTSTLQAGIVLLLLLVQSPEQLWLVDLASLALNGARIFFGPAENALLPRLVSTEHLLAANSLNALNNSLARLIGPVLAGGLLLVTGLPGVVVVDSASFAVAALLITLVSYRAAARPTPAAEPGADMIWRQLWGEWIEGLRFVWRHRLIATLFTVLVLISFGGIMYDPLMPAFVIDILRGGPDVQGWLATIQAAGGIGGSLVVARFGQALAPGKLLGWSCVGTGLLLLVEFNVPFLPLTFLLSFLIGSSAVATGAAAQTLAQRHVPDEYLGRAFGALGTTTAILSLFSVLGLAGVLGEVVGLLPMLNVATGITLIAGLIGVVLLSPRAGATGRASLGERQPQPGGEAP
jgi:MFS family permease